MADKPMTIGHAWHRLMARLGGPGPESHLFKYQDGRALLVIFTNRMKRR